MIRVADIYKESIVDGEGYRMAIFLQGCNHHCKGCHNPQTWDFNGGTEMEISDIIDMYNSDIMDGITLSGGDPFFQADKLQELFNYCEDKSVSLWAYTGFIFDEFLKYINNEPCDNRINDSMINMLKYTEVVVDGPFILEQRTVEALYRGSTNQRLVDVKKSLAENRVVEYIPE